MKNKKYFIAVGIIIFITTVYVLMTNPFVNDFVNSKRFSRRIEKIDDTQIISLNDLTPFKWDSVYWFSPYTPVETIEEIMGIETNLIISSGSEESLTLFFIQDNKIVCSINSLSSNLGYDFDFGSSGENYYVKIDSNDSPTFYVDKSEDIIMFTLSDIY